jgi:hypothetical protein
MRKKMKLEKALRYHRSLTFHHEPAQADLHARFLRGLKRSMSLGKMPRKKMLKAA